MTTATMLRVGNLMTVDPVVIDPEATVHEAELVLKTYRISGLPVVAGGEAVTLTPDAEAHGLALALPERVNMRSIARGVRVGGEGLEPPTSSV